MSAARAALGAAALSGCVPHPPDEAAEESLEDHACEHRGEPGEPVTAAPDGDDPPVLALSEEPVTVTLVPRALGFVALEVAEDTAGLLFLGDADVVTALRHVHEDGDVEEAALPAPAPAEPCPDDIPEHYDLDLHAGTWQLGVGPAGIDTLWLLVASADAHDHAHE